MSRRARRAARWAPFLIHVLPLVLIFAVVVGAMTAGWATPTEAAALGAAGDHRRGLALSQPDLRQSDEGADRHGGDIRHHPVHHRRRDHLRPGAELLRRDQRHRRLVAGQGLSATVVILGMMLILLFLGCFVDQVSMMLITLPFFMPLVAQLGVDPIWFGVLFLICMQLGLLTPPFGLSAVHDEGRGAAAHHHERRLSFGDALRVVRHLLMLLLVFLWPPLATWLPRLLGRLIDDREDGRGADRRRNRWTRSSCIPTKAGRFRPSSS